MEYSGSSKMSSGKLAITIHVTSWNGVDWVGSVRETFETEKKEKRKRMVKHYRWRRSMVDKLLFKSLSLPHLSPPSLSLSLLLGLSVLELGLPEYLWWVWS